MSNPEYFTNTRPVDPATLEPVVPEGVEDLLQDTDTASGQGGCCGGACCS